jgi:hypothetical protein
VYGPRQKPEGIGRSSTSQEVDVKLLEEIPAFPAKLRHTLEREFGIDSAESFYANATHNPEGIAAGLHADRAEIDRLIKIVEGYLPAGYAKRCRQPIRRPRGLVVDE